MATITTIAAGDQITNSRTDINTNFANLNSDKVETSAIDTDTSLAANSDAKIPSQKAVKMYVDAGGNVNASTTNKGIVEEATAAEVLSLSATGGTSARLFMNPSTAVPIFGIKSVTAGATINGATLPVPVYQNKTDNEFYACDGNDTAAMKFLGFAISNGTDGAAMTVQFNGIVSGFTGLAEGEKYYLSDTVGTITNTIGTYEVLVGVAISETELLIQRGRRRASGTITSTEATTTTTLTVGFRASIIRFYARNAATSEFSEVRGIYTNGVLSALATHHDAAGSNTAVEFTGKLYDNTSWPTIFMTLSVSNITDTTFDIVQTETGSYGTLGTLIIWEAEGEL